MATVARNFTHLDVTCKKGDVLPDDHPLVAAAPHLFQPKSKPKPRSGTKKETP